MLEVRTKKRRGAHGCLVAAWKRRGSGARGEGGRRVIMMMLLMPSHCLHPSGRASLPFLSSPSVFSQTHFLAPGGPGPGPALSTLTRAWRYRGDYMILS